MKRMQTPHSRAEFERNFYLLIRQINDGKFHIPADFDSFDSLYRIRFLPNGRIDFLSVDEFARLNANMMANTTDGLFDDQTEKSSESQSQSDTESNT